MDGISYLFKEDRVIQLALMDELGVSIELVAAIAGDGGCMVVNVCCKRLLVVTEAR